jgi:hypothetical protein
MEQETINRLTIVGLIIFFALGISYLCWGNISAIFANLSVNMPSDSPSLPVSMPDISLDWFYAMDMPSQIILGFLAIVLVSTLIGCTLLYLKYRKHNTSR